MIFGSCGTEQNFCSTRSWKFSRKCLSRLPLQPNLLDLLDQSFLLLMVNTSFCLILQWIPEPPPNKKKSKTKTKKSLLSGFGVSSLITEKIDEDVSISFSFLKSPCIVLLLHPCDDCMKNNFTLAQEPDPVFENYDPFPKSDFMKKFKPSHDTKRPSPDACILEILNRQLKVSSSQFSCMNSTQVRKSSFQ